jgi:serine/threonine protein kinase
MAPEGFLKSTYGPKTDVWSFGVMVYELFHGKTPFSWCSTEKDLKASILKPIKYEDLKLTLSHDVKDLILSCLVIDEGHRPSIGDLQNYAFIQRVLRLRNN